MSSSNNDDLNNIFGDSDDGLFPAEFGADEANNLEMDNLFDSPQSDPLGAAESFDSDGFPGIGEDGGDPAPIDDFSNVSEESGFDAPLPTDAIEPEDSDVSDKKTKKGKAEKKKRVKKEKKAKVPKFKEPKRPVPWSIADVLLFIYGFLTFLGVIAINVAVFMKYQMAALHFFIIFDILAIFLLLVPWMLFRRSRTGIQPNFFDVLLGLSLTLVIVSAMMVLSIQSIKYGSNIKADLPSIPGLPAAQPAPEAPAAPAAQPAPEAPAAPAAQPAPATPAAPAGQPAPATPAAPSP